MTQQINFIPTLPGRKVLLPAELMLAIITGVTLVLFFISVGFEVVSFWKGDEYAKTMQDQKVVAQQFLDLARENPLIAGDASVADKVKAISQQLAAKKALWEALSHISLKQGFSRYLMSLAKKVPAGVWLNQIVIDQRLVSTLLRGGSIQVQLIPRLMGQLKEAEGFKGQLLNIFDLSKQAQSNVISFSISNKSLQKTTQEIKKQPLSIKSQAQKDSEKLAKTKALLSKVIEDDE